MIAPGSNVTSCFESPRPAVLCGASTPQAPQRHTNQNSSLPCAPVPSLHRHTHYLWMGVARAPSCPVALLECYKQIDGSRGEHRWLLRHEAVCEPLRGKVSAWAISVIMAAHALGGLDKQGLRWQMVRVCVCVCVFGKGGFGGEKNHHNLTLLTRWWIVCALLPLTSDIKGGCAGHSCWSDLEKSTVVFVMRRYGSIFVCIAVVQISW